MLEGFEPILLLLYPLFIFIIYFPTSFPHPTCTYRLWIYYISAVCLFYILFFDTLKIIALLFFSHFKSWKCSSCFWCSLPNRMGVLCWGSTLAGSGHRIRPTQPELRTISMRRWNSCARKRLTPERWWPLCRHSTRCHSMQSQTSSGRCFSAHKKQGKEREIMDQLYYRNMSTHGVLA